VFLNGTHEHHRETSTIGKYEENYDYKIPFADLNFNTLFEEEHGLSILTDGKFILGTGYMHDAIPLE